MGGFAFILLFIFVLMPITITLAIVWGVTQKNIYGKVLGFVWLSVIGIILLIVAISFFTNKKELTRNEVYGEYIIDRTKFPGEQSNWQYNHFRFEITKQDEFLFYEIDNEKIIKTHKGKIEFLDAYKSPRIVLQSDSTSHHIMEKMPTLYRQVWNFYYVFKSPKFGNVFFAKGKWKAIDK